MALAQQTDRERLEALQQRARLEELRAVAAAEAASAPEPEPQRNTASWTREEGERPVIGLRTAGREPLQQRVLRSVASGALDAVSGLTRTAEDIAPYVIGGGIPVQDGARLSTMVPDVQTYGEGEEALAAVTQYVAPGLGAAKLVSTPLQVMTRNLPSALRWGANLLGQGTAAMAADAAVTIPEEAVTLGDAIHEWTGIETPTRIREDDSDMTRRLKVGLEGMGMTGAIGVLGQGIGSSFDFARRIWSATHNADQMVSETLRDSVRRAARTATGSPVDDAADALQELIDAQRAYAASGGDVASVPEHMRQFVANDVQVTPAEYLAAREINYGPVEVQRSVSTDPRVIARETDNAGRIEQASQRTTGDIGENTEGLRLEAEADVATAQRMVDEAEEATRDEITSLYTRLQAETENAARIADEVTDEVSALLRGADEARAAENIDEAVRLERQAAANVRDALYDAVDPNGELIVDPAILRRAFDNVRETLPELFEEVPSARILARNIERVVSQENVSFRDIQQLQRRFSRVASDISGNNAFGAFADDFRAFRSGVMDRYTEQIAEAGSGAEEVLRIANQFMREEFAPRFREFAGGSVDMAQRTRATGSREVGAEFVNKGITQGEDANALDRILRGVTLSDSDLQTVMARFNAGETVGVGNLQTRTAEEYTQSIRDVTEMLLGRLGRQTGGDVTPAAANRFLRDYEFALRSFPPEVRTALEEVAEMATTVQGRREVAKVIGAASRRLRPYAEDIGNLTPESALRTLSSVADDLRAQNMGPDEALAAARDYQRAARIQQETAEQEFTQLFAGQTPKRAIRQMMGRSDPAATIREVFDTIGRTPENETMMRQSFADYLREDVVGMPRGSMPPTQARNILGRLNKFLSDAGNREIIEELYGSDALRAMDTIQDQIATSQTTRMVVRTGALDPNIARNIRKTVQDISVEMAGAGMTGSGGLGSRVKQRSVIQLINRIQAMTGGNIDKLVADRMIDIALDPQAALLALRRTSESQALNQTIALLTGGRTAFLALRGASTGGEETSPDSQPNTTRAVP